MRGIMIFLVLCMPFAVVVSAAENAPKKVDTAPAKETAAKLPVYEIKEEVVLDTASKLMWQRKKAEKTLPHKEAEEYCSSLVLGGFDDWRLPTITELRTLIVGCQSSTTVCKISDKCLSSSCWSSTCACKAGGGAGEDGFYWLKDVWLGGGKYFWSSSVQSDKTDNAWDVGFNYGNVYEFERKKNADVRCVRTNGK